MIRRFFEPIEVEPCSRCGYEGVKEQHSGRCMTCGFSAATPEAYPASSLYYTHRQLWTMWQMSLMIGAVIHGIVVVGFPLGHDPIAIATRALLALLIGEALTLPITLLALQSPEGSARSQIDALRRCALVGLIPALVLAPVGLLLYLLPTSGDRFEQ